MGQAVGASWAGLGILWGMRDMKGMNRRELLTLALHSLAISGGVLLLYLATLAPTVLWGDDAEFQRLAFTGRVGAGVRSYPLWVAVAHSLSRWLPAEAAWSANLVSALCAALVVGVLFVLVSGLTHSRPAGWVAGLALAFSHTFWLHAVRAEVYTLFLLGYVLVLALLWGWRLRPAGGLLLAAFGLAGLTLLAHRLLLTAWPALGYWLVRVPKPRPGRAYALALAGLLLGGLPFLLLVLLPGRGAAGEIEGELGLVRLRDVGLGLGFWGYQFLFLLPLGVWGAWRQWRADRPGAVFLGLLWGGSVLFALSFRVNDQYVFYLPAYLVFAVWLGWGAADWLARLAGRARAVWLVGLLLLAAGAPPLVYRLTPAALNYLDLDLLPGRDVPYRDNNLFFLYPPKAGYDGARRYAAEVLASLPPDAALLADWTPLQPLLYLQVVEGVRPDVLLVQIHPGRGQQLPWLLAQSRTRPVFLADLERYYDLAEIETRFELLPYGLVYQALPYPPSTPCTAVGWWPGSKAATSAARS